MFGISTILFILPVFYHQYRGAFIISFEPVWETMKAKNVTTYTLREKHNISSETIYRMKHNKAITTTTLDDLCKILDCKVDEVIKHIKDR